MDRRFLSYAGETPIFRCADHACPIIIEEVSATMRRTLSLLILLSLILSLALIACSGGTGAPKVEWEIKISGAVSKPGTITYQDLAKKKQVELKEVLMRRSQGEDTTTNWEGPALDDILQEAGISANAKSILFVASDGYAKEMNIADLSQAIIALKGEGKWLAGDEKGPLRLVIPDQPANSWISQITEIQVTE
jgi:hypothetical protein